MKNHLSLRLSDMVVFCKPKTIIVKGANDASFMQGRTGAWAAKKFSFLNSPRAKPSP